MKKLAWLVVLACLLLAAVAFFTKNPGGRPQEALEKGRAVGEKLSAYASEWLGGGVLVSEKSSGREEPITDEKKKRLPQLVQQFKECKVPYVTKDGLRGLWEAHNGNAVQLNFPGFSVSGELDFVSEKGDLKQYGVTLTNPEGRLVLSVLDNGRLAGSMFFDGEEVAFSISGYEDGGRWPVKLSCVEDELCSAPTSKYPLAQEDYYKSEKPKGFDLVVTDPILTGLGVPVLNSLPGCPNVIYLNFDGEEVHDMLWNGGQRFVAAPAPRREDVEWVSNIWNRVAEDYAHMNVNITTERAAYEAANSSDRIMCIITFTDTVAPGAGGVAWVSSFGAGTPCWAFNLYSDYIAAETISHEVGHTLGLYHDGRKDGDSYYGGHGSGVLSWAPIMGAPWSDSSTSVFESVTQWSKGDYPGANTLQDDLEVMTGTLFGVGYREDDYADDTSGASPLAVVNGSISQSGVIGSSTDVDYFSLQLPEGGSLTITGKTVEIVSSESEGTLGSNLALRLELYDEEGSLISYDEPPTQSGASLATELQPGRYYVKVAGSGREGSAKGDPPDVGFSSYASMGHYTLNGAISSGTPSPIMLKVSGGDGMDVEIPPGDEHPSESKGTDYGIVTNVEGSKSSTFQIENVGQTEVYISNTTSNSDAFALENDTTGTLLPGQNMVVSIRFTPESNGEQHGLITILSDDPSNSHYDFTIKALGSMSEPDTDGDGVADIHEDANRDGNLANDDSDSDGYPDYNDPLPGIDTDTDIYDAVLEYAFGGTGKTGLNLIAGTEYPMGPRLVKKDEGISLELIRPAGRDAVTYSAEYSQDFTTWSPLSNAPQVVDNGDGTSTLVWGSENDVFQGSRGFIRLAVGAPQVGSGQSITKPLGFCKTTLQGPMQSFSIPFLNNPIATGVFGNDSSGSTLDMGDALANGDLSSSMDFSNHSYFLEVTDGDNEGARFDIAAAQEGMVKIKVDNTDDGIHTSAPALLEGDSYVIRRHLKLSEVFVPEDWQAGTSPSNADTLNIWNGEGYITYFLLSGGIWYNSAQGVSNDLTLPPATAMLLKFANADASYTMTSMGEVRDYNMQIPLSFGMNFMGNPFPFPLSLSDIGLTNNTRLLSGTSSSNSDCVYTWQGDQEPDKQLFKTIFLHRDAGWLSFDPIKKYNNESILLPCRALFLKIRNSEGLPEWKLLSP